MSESNRAPSASGSPVLRVEHLSKFFAIRGGVFSTVHEWIRAVDDVSFEVERGRTLGLVGESGCGKTTVGRTLLGLIPPTSGRVIFDEKSLFDLPSDELRSIRRRIQIIFQDPYGSLNPRMTIHATIAEPLRLHGIVSRADTASRVRELMSLVGMRPDAAARYPHEFSGGQRQRIGIARALAAEPDFIVCDEPTSALDVSIRAQIVNLLRKLQDTRGLSYLFISHDLGVVRHVSHEGAVMYLGRIVEQAPTAALYHAPRHPYSRVLLSAIPVPDPRKRRTRVTALDDEIPSPVNLPPGCPFHPRCPLYELKGRPERCRVERPLLRGVEGAENHRAACHFAEESEAVLSGSPRLAG